MTTHPHYETRIHPKWWAAALLLAPPAFADGGLPLLLAAGWIWFLFGTVVIVFIEAAFLTYKYEDMEFHRCMKISWKANLISGLAGFVLLPALVAFPLSNGLNNMWIGTWMTPFNTSDGWKPIYATAGWLFLMFWLTILIEWKVIRSEVAKRDRTFGFSHSIVMNAISYAALILMLVLLWGFDVLL